jgi:hypothetical protein
MHQLAICIVLVLLGAGCSHPLSPSDVAGQYALTAAHGSPLPTLVRVTTDCDLTLLSGALTLRNDATFRLDHSDLLDCSRIGHAPSQSAFFAVGTFVLDGTNITLNAQGDVTYPFAGRISGRTLQVDWGPVYEDLTFVRP